jgi:hypothetical protein
MPLYHDRTPGTIKNIFPAPVFFFYFAGTMKSILSEAKRGPLGQYQPLER